MVERTLESVVCSDVSPAFDISMHLLTAGGKRIRPALMILSAMASGECDPERLAYLAAATELVHMASLVHDDVIDETRERRGVITAAESYGNKISVLGGDYLLAKGLHLLSTYGTPEILRSLSSNAIRMTESEILQASAEGDLARGKRTTGALSATRRPGSWPRAANAGRCLWAPNRTSGIGCANMACSLGWRFR